MHKKIKALLHHSEFVIFTILLVLVASISFINPDFGTAQNFFDILRSSTFIGICSLGFLVVLISGGIDISFTATATVAQYIMGTMLVSSTDFPVFLIILVPLFTGIILGAVNAVVINYLKVPAIVVTIATLNIYYGAVQFISKGAWLYNFPQWFLNFTKVLVLKFTNADGVQYGLSILTIIWILIMAAGALMLKYTILGRAIYAIGGSIESAKRTGINVNRIRLFCYSFLGFVSSIAAIIHASMTQTIAPNALIGLEFNALSAVVLGGANIMGGAGTVLGTFLGVILMSVITNALTILKVPSFWHQIFIGMILILSVSATATRTRIVRNREVKIDVQ